jgi:Protein of unknown function (DUF3040)
VLDDREREALHEIQRQLLVEDPGFAQSFDTETQALDTQTQRVHRGAPDVTRRTYTILLVLSSTYGVILLLAGSPISALMLAAMAALIWEARRRRGGTSHQRPCPGTAEPDVDL